MKHLLQNRESDYFNENDYYLLYNTLNRLFVTKVFFRNGAWYSNVSLKYKMTSVPSINCNEIYGKEVEYLDTTLKGVVSKFLEPNNIGVNWHQGQEYRKYGMPYYWNEIENLKIL